MQLSFRNAAWKTGVILMLVFIGTQVGMFLSANHDWRRVTDMFGVLTFAMILTCLTYAFTAQIGKLGRTFWLVFIVTYITLFLVGFYQFYTSAD